ncbi:MAG: sensor histidine kinase [Leptolyngbyaceae cyanobacterium CSU_1_3]|nr:sensor histidine kinase [Leptolyngbyaceae cyanobacterium CSU_1_3]
MTQKSIAPPIPTVLSIRNMLRYVEWTILAVIVATIVLDTSPNYWREIPIWGMWAVLGILVLLSLIFPIERPLWQRRAYVWTEILLVIFAQVTCLDLSVLLYFQIAKSCFLLDRRDVVITVITTGIAWNVVMVLSLPKAIELTRTYPLDNTRTLLTSLLVNGIGGYLAASTFVILFSFAMLSERKSRQRAEALSKEVEVLAADLERTRIAREIHDSLGHTLTTLDVQLEVAQKLRQRNPDQALQALDTAKLLATQCLQDVRQALQPMREAEFDLNKALIALIEQIQQNQRLTIDLDLNLPPLPLQTSHQLYCIVQEGFTNIQKHAQASCASLHSHATTDHLTLKLSDDGQGFDPQIPVSGFGLRGMQERVQMLGGNLTIATAPSKGTQIEVTIPQ